jgi:L-arabinose isomerase
MASDFTVGVVTTYFGLFDEAMPAGFREERLSAGEVIALALEDAAACRAAPVVDSAAGAISAIEFLRLHPVDALIIVPTMATPPEWAVSIVRALAPLPTLVVARRESRVIPDDYDTTQATRHSLLVGVVMLTNVLNREGLPYELVVLPPDREAVSQELSPYIKAMQAAAAVRGAKLLAWGDPIEGYSDVAVTPEALTSLGPTRVQVDVSDIEHWSSSLTTEAIAGIVSDARSLGSLIATAEELDRAARVAATVRQALNETGCTAGAINCHSDLVRGHPQLGVTACLATALEANRGVMLACTGDLPVAIAMLMGKIIAGAALYCELYAIDEPGDWILVANGGEGDCAMASGEVQLLSEDHYKGVHGAGVAVAYSMQTGDATLISLSPMPGARGGWQLVLAAAEVIDSRHHQMEGPNAMLRFRHAPAVDAFLDWCAAGASHHAVLLPGDQGQAVTLAARFLGIEVRVMAGPAPAGTTGATG